MNEIALIEDAQSGNLDAFNQLVLAYQNIIYSQAYHILGEVDAANDVTQEAFISAYRNLHLFRGGSFRAWLFRIVTNACYDEYRRRQRHPVTPLEPVNEYGEEFESPQWIIDPAERPEESLERVELAQALQNCLNQLSVDFRMVVVLCDVQGLDYVDVAKDIGRPLGTVKSRLARARLQLRDCLQGFGELLPTVFRFEREGC